MPGTFIIIDGSSLIHRAFYALPLLATASGQYTNAVYGLTTMLVRLIGEIKPDAIAVAFDKGRITFRNDAYSEYKAHRKATPNELVGQFPIVHELLNAFGICILEEQGYEADDIIGTLASKAGTAGYDVIIVTGDRDALQLINPAVKVMLTKKGITDVEVVDDKSFIDKYGVTPEQFIDVKGLMGDSSDNIPGVPGIGEKTALKLIAEFGSVEGLLANLDMVPGKKLQETLRNHAEMAALSKKLARIACDMPLDFLPEKFIMRPKMDKLYELLQKYEFKSLLLKMDTIFPDETAQRRKADRQLPSAKILSKLNEIGDLIYSIRQEGILAFYPVLTGQVPSLCLQGLGIATNADLVYIAQQTAGWDKILALFADRDVLKITHDAKVLYNWCNSTGLALEGLGFDTLIAAYLIDPTAAEYTLPLLAEKYLNQYATGQGQFMQDNPDFAAWAAGVVKELYPVIQRQLVEANLDRLYYEIELPLTRILAAMEFCGIKLDYDGLVRMAEETTAKIDRLIKEIYLIAGEEFNVNSTKQLGHVLYDKLKLPILKKTKTGYSTDAEVLEKLAGQHPIIDALLEYRMLTKLKSTYLDGLKALIHPLTGRIHTTFNQTVTATGRLSSSDPNLQNIPIRTEAGRRIRELFIPGDGWDYIVSADYSQIELRVLAHMSADPGLVEAFQHAQDIHTRTAAQVFSVPLEEVTPAMRAKAKAVNFGIVYGISDYGLSRDIGVSRKEASLYIENYFAKYSGVKRYIDCTLAEARQLGYVTTLMGRRRFLPDLNNSNFNQRSFAERTAMNTPIQGTAADIIKKAMIDVFAALKAANLRSRLLLQVHDELVLEVTEEELPLVSQIVRDSMEQAIHLSVPLVTDVKKGKNWAEAK